MDYSINYLTLRFKSRQTEKIYRESQFKREHKKITAVTCLSFAFLLVSLKFVWAKDTLGVVFSCFNVLFFGFIGLFLYFLKKLSESWLRTIKFIVFVYLLTAVWGSSNVLLREAEVEDNLLATRLIYLKDTVNVVMWTMFYDFSLCSFSSMVLVNNLLFLNRNIRTDYYDDSYWTLDLAYLECLILLCSVMSYFSTLNKKQDYAELSKLRSSSNIELNTEKQEIKSEQKSSEIGQKQENALFSTLFRHLLAENTLSISIESLCSFLSLPAPAGDSLQVVLDNKLISALSSKITAVSVENNSLLLSSSSSKHSFPLRHITLTEDGPVKANAFSSLLDLLNKLNSTVSTVKLNSDNQSAFSLISLFPHIQIQSTNQK